MTGIVKSCISLCVLYLADTIHTHKELADSQVRCERQDASTPGEEIKV